MIHDPSRCSENDVSKLTRGKQFDDPFFKVAYLDVVAGTDDASLVYTGANFSVGGLEWR